MVKRTKTKWLNTAHFKHIPNINFPTRRRVAADAILKTVGGAACYGLGLLVGEGMEHIPYLSEGVTQVVDFFSNIDINENLSGLMGVIGGVYGLAESGVVTDTYDTNILEQVRAGGIGINLDKPKSSR